MLNLMNDSGFIGTLIRIILVVFGSSVSFSLLVTFFSYLSSASKAGMQVSRKEKNAQSPEDHFLNYQYYTKKSIRLKQSIVNFCKRELFFVLLFAGGTVFCLITLFIAKYSALFIFSLMVLTVPLVRNYLMICGNGGFKRLISSLNKSVKPYLPPTEVVYDVYREYDHEEREYLGTRTRREVHVGENLITFFINAIVKLFKFFLIVGASYGIGLFFLLLALYYCVFGSLGFRLNGKKAAKSFQNYVFAAARPSFAIIAFPICTDPKLDKIPKRVINELAATSIQCELENRVPEILCMLSTENTYCVSSGNRFLFTGTYDETDYRIYENSVGLIYTYLYDENTLAGTVVPFFVEPELRERYLNSPVEDDLRAFFNWMQFEYLKYEKENENGSRIIRLFDYGKKEQIEAPLSDFVLDLESGTFSVASSDA